MLEADSKSVRKTTADDVFERLHDDITALRLAPGDRLSEGEVAKQLEVSRQPVREAFIRLHELELLRIRPQKATEVRRISETAARQSCFLRIAVEIEVLRNVCAKPLGGMTRRFERNLKLQRKAIEGEQLERFQTLDYEFHQLLCVAGECEFVYPMIASSKSQISSVCMLTLADRDQLERIFDDHQRLFDYVRAGDEAGATALIRQHLSRLADILKQVRQTHPEYFEGH